MNATTQAIEHCKSTTKNAYALPSSRCTVAIAATHGVYNSENTRNTNGSIPDISVSAKQKKSLITHFPFK